MDLFFCDRLLLMFFARFVTFFWTKTTLRVCLGFPTLGVLNENGERGRNCTPISLEELAFPRFCCRTEATEVVEHLHGVTNTTVLRGAVLRTWTKVTYILCTPTSIT